MSFEIVCRLVCIINIFELIIRVFNFSVLVVLGVVSYFICKMLVEF